MADRDRSGRPRTRINRRAGTPSRARGDAHAGRPAGAEPTRAQAPPRQEPDADQLPGGLAGFFAKRAKTWSLDAYNAGFVRGQRHFWNLVMDHYFRMEIEGWHRLPPAPVLLVGVHAGGITPMDAWTLGFAWQRRFEGKRMVHGTAHDALFAAPVLGDYFRRLGVLPASPESITAALAAGHDVALWPGGDLDAMRPWRRRDEVVLAGRRGFVKQAIRSNVPIVPVATVGGADTVIVLSDGRRIAKALRLDKLARSEVFPIAVGAPWGIAPAVLPFLPLPAKIRTELLEPVEIDGSPGREDDDEYVDEIYAEVERRLQEGVDRLARRRSFPIFG